MTQKFAAMVAAALALAGPAGAEQFKTEKVDIDVTPVASGLNQPWAVEVLPDGAYIVTEKEGGVRIVRDGKVSDAIKG